MGSKLTFNEQEINGIFGHEAAEDESTERLKQYYFKSNIFNHVVTDLPLRILVGHKGVGKSALFQVAMADEETNGRLTINIKPDDIVNLALDTSNFLKIIQSWKIGLTEIIAKKILSDFGIENKFTDTVGMSLKGGVGFLNFYPILLVP